MLILDPAFSVTTVRTLCTIVTDRTTSLVQSTKTQAKDSWESVNHSKKTKNNKDMKAVLLIILGILFVGLIFGIVILIKNIAELIYINRALRSFEQFHAETEQMIYGYCMKNNMTRDQFFDKMSESLKQ